MQESALAKEALEQALASAAGRKISSITLEIGELAPVEPGDVTAIIRNATGAKVTAEIKESLISCACGYNGRAEITIRHPENVQFKCPQCGSETPTIIEGDKVRVKTIELE